MEIRLLPALRRTIASVATLMRFAMPQARRQHRQLMS